MKLGLNLGYAPPGTNPADLVPLVQEAERLGFDSVWTAEAWGTDAVTVLAYLAAKTETIKLGSAIMQIPGRTPTNTAMTAATLDLLSGGRFLLGLGTSGPQVVEGWHGQPWGKPLGKTREYVEIVRGALRRDVVEHAGDHYRIPWDGPGATGLGKPLKLMLRPLRAEIPIYLAALGPKNVALAAEIADGWLPIFYSPFRAPKVYQPSLDDGFRKAGGGKSLASFDIAVSAAVIVSDDVQGALRMVKPQLALYIGGMGARGKNFYNDICSAYGYEKEAGEVQDLYLDGKKAEAAAAVPGEMLELSHLVGPRGYIKERIGAFKEAGVTVLSVNPVGGDPVKTIETLRAIVDEA